MLELQAVVHELLERVVAEVVGNGVPGGRVVHGVLLPVLRLLRRQGALLDQPAALQVHHHRVPRLQVALDLDQLHLPAVRYRSSFDVCYAVVVMIS